MNYSIILSLRDLLVEDLDIQINLEQFDKAKIKQLCIISDGGSDDRTYEIGGMSYFGDMIFKILSRFNSESDNIVWMFETFDKLRSLENDILNKLNDTLDNIEVIDLKILDVKRDTVLLKNNSIIYSSTVRIQYYYN